MAHCTKITFILLLYLIEFYDATRNKTDQLFEPSLELTSTDIGNGTTTAFSSSSTVNSLFARLLMRPIEESNSTEVPRGNLNHEYWSKLAKGAIASGLNYYRQLTMLEQTMQISGLGLTSPEDGAFIRYYSYDERMQKDARQALALMASSRYLTIQTKPSFEDFIDFELFAILQINFRSSPLAGFCKGKSECKKIKKIAGIEYRNSDGSCNNRLMPHWGMAGAGYYRELASQPYYDDIVNAPRTLSVDRVTKLPSARVVSNKLSPTSKDTPHAQFTVLMMQFGQFVSHDFSEIQVPLPLQEQSSLSEKQYRKGIGFDCCSLISKTTLVPVLKHHPECFPIEVPPDDPYYSKFGVTCLNFLRALPAKPSFCNFPFSREQLNAQSSYLDLGQVYGNSDEKVASIRAFKSGLLLEAVLHKKQNSKTYPPKDKNYSTCTIPPESKFSCFKTGDDRGNMHLWLSALQITFFRYHNKIATSLGQVNPEWDDERIFQETRRLLIAVYQHIIYTEHLPSILGPQVMQSFRLSPLKTGYFHGYMPKLDGSASITTSVNSYRLHNLIPSRIFLLHSNRNSNGQSSSSSSSSSSTSTSSSSSSTSGSIPLSSTYFDPRVLHKDASAFDQVLNGMITMPMQTFDRFLTSEVTNKLFLPKDQAYGLDLGAVDIQRGRDTGLSGYNSWINFCGFEKFRDIDDLSREFSPNFVSTMKSLYKNVDDIDFWAAGIEEKPVPGGVIGKTFACVSGMHFARLKFGDRFWYENPMPDVAFTGSKLIHLLK